MKPENKMKMKINWGLIGSLFMMVVALFLGVSDIGQYCMAADPVVTAMEGAGKTVEHAEGAPSLTMGREANADLYLSEVDKRITKMRPMTTPIDQISRYSEAKSSASMRYDFYSVSTKGIETTLSTAITETAADRKAIDVADSTMFAVTDTIRVVGINGYKEDGTTVDTGRDLMLYIIDINDSGQPVCISVNGKKNGSYENVMPAIAAGTKLIRMGRAGAELDIQTGAFANIPTKEYNYCQKFMAQVEQSTLDKIEKKEVDWNFSDLEEDSIYDMRMGMENSFLFGAKRMIKDPKKKQDVYFTGGIWWMAGKDIEVGTKDATTSVVSIDDNELVDIAKALFCGTGVGNKRKVAIMGSDMLATFAKIKSERFKLKESVENWNLKFKSFDTDFGELLAIHSELFDMNNMSDCGFAIDPEYLSKITHKPWESLDLDLRGSGQRDSTAKVLSEISCLILRYPMAHARLKLKA